MRAFLTLLLVAAASFAQDDTQLASAVDDLLADRNVRQARAALEGVQDRAAVVAALKRTLDRDGFFKGKLNVLRTLSKWSPRTVRAALDSKSRSSRRAAAWVMHTDPSAADKVRKIVVDWLKDAKAALLFDEEADPKLVGEVTLYGYGELDEIGLEKVGRDPFLISYGYADKTGRTIVTLEVSAPSKRGANRKIPDVCADLGIACRDLFEFIKALDFTTNWKPG